MSAFGYKRTLLGTAIYVRFPPQSGHNLRVLRTSAYDPKRTLRHDAPPTKNGILVRLNNAVGDEDARPFGLCYSRRRYASCKTDLESKHF